MTDETESFEQAQKASRTPETLTTLGNHYAQGFGTPMDMTKAVECWKTAISESTTNPPPCDACFNLGLWYMNEDKIVLAMRYFRKGAEQGDMECQVELGNCWYHLRQNVKRARTWWKRAARTGSCDAEMNLGRSYLEEEDGPRAWKHFNCAATQGDEEAQDWIKLYPRPPKCKPMDPSTTS